MRTRLEEPLPSSRSEDINGIMTPSQEEIAVRAYELYQERGAINGHDLDNWLDAERQLTEQRRDQFVHA